MKKERIVGLIVVVVILILLLMFFNQKQSDTTNSQSISLSSTHSVVMPEPKPIINAATVQADVSAELHSSVAAKPNKLKHKHGLPSPVHDGNGAPVVNASPAQPAKPVQASNGWVIQLGTFGDAANAGELLGRLKDKGFQAYSEKHSVNGHTMTQVFVGPVPTQMQAEQTKQLVDKQFHVRSMVKKS